MAVEKSLSTHLKSECPVREVFFVGSIYLFDVVQRCCSLPIPDSSFLQCAVDYVHVPCTRVSVHCSEGGVTSVATGRAGLLL